MVYTATRTTAARPAAGSGMHVQLQQQRVPLPLHTPEQRVVVLPLRQLLAHHPVRWRAELDAGVPRERLRPDLEPAEGTVRAGQLGQRGGR